jgi:rhodanese-related sulfurtransferase
MIRSLTGTVMAILALGIAAAAAPEIHVDSDTYDFGTIVEGFAVEHTFVLSNVGDETLIIDRVYAGCGCTTTALATKELEPGESVELHAVVNTSGFGGTDVSKPIYVYSNDPRFAEEGGPTRLVLYITGSVLRAEAYNTTAEDVYLYALPLIDLRSEEEFAAGHLVGALNISSDALLESLDGLPQENVIVLYDATGESALDLVEDVIGAGFPFARALAGGLAAWADAYGAQYLFPKPASLDFGDPSTITIADISLQPFHLHSALSVLVDLRTPEEYAVGHLVGATNIPIDAFDVANLTDWLGDLPYDARIVVYDRSGTGSDDVAQELIAAGYAEAKSLLGGLDEWEHIYGNQLIWPESP